MRKHMVIIPCLVAVLLLTACGAPAGGEQSAAQPASADPESVIAKYVADAEEVFSEDAKAMKDNQASMFDGGLKKEMSDDGYAEFVNTTDSYESISLNKALDAFQNTNAKTGQAIYVRFQPVENFPSFTLSTLDPLHEIHFSYSSGNLLLYYFPESKSIKQNTKLSIRSNEWYNLFITMDKNGNYRAMLWQDGEEESAAQVTAGFGLGDNGDEFKNHSWHFFFDFDEQGSVKLDRYAIYSFSEYAQQ